MSKVQCMNCMEEFDESISSICPHCGFDRNQPVQYMNVLVPGTVLAERYFLGNKIKDNTTGFTYIAWDNFSSTKVLIKEYFPVDLCERTSGQTKVVVNISSGAKFEKGKDIFVKKGNAFKEKCNAIPGMAKVNDLFSENGTAYIVMEYVEGISVGEVIATKQMPWNSFKSIIRPVVETMMSVHKNNLTILSIEPENIIVTRERAVKIIDFDCLNDDKVTTSKSVNRAQDVYSPLELYRSGSKLTPAGDVYSVAAVIYRTITGKDVPPSVKRGKKDALVPPSELGAQIDKDTEAALLNALDVDLADRTKDSKEFYEQLFGDNKVERNDVKSGASKKTIAIFSVIAVVVVAIIAVCAGILMKPGGEPVVNETAIGSVPNVVTLTVKEAKAEVKKLKQQGIDIKLVTDKEAVPDGDSANDGKIANQTPKAGTSIYESDNGELQLVVKLYSYDPDAEKIGDKKIEMPSLYNKTEQESKDILDKAGFTNFSYQQVYSQEVDAGNVVKQSVSEGESVQANSEIIIYISMGPEPTTTQAPTTKRPSNSGGNSGNSATNSNSGGGNEVVNNEDLFG